MPAREALSNFEVAAVAAEIIEKIIRTQIKRLAFKADARRRARLIADRRAALRVVLSIKDNARTCAAEQRAAEPKGAA